MKRGRQESHAGLNLEAASIIAADTLKYGGDDAGLVRWARLVLSQQQMAIGGDR